MSDIRSHGLPGEWIGVDFDGTLATWDRWVGPLCFGKPIPLMVARVKAWLAEGKYEVKIFTARVAHHPDLDYGNVTIGMVRTQIQLWCLEHVGRMLDVVCAKDHLMVQLWDDRCVQVIPNTGMPVQGHSEHPRSI